MIWELISSLFRVLANCEYPNGLALAPDERTMYVATPARPYLAAAFESF
jgi:sugar lactone lactonase YvrE